MVVVDERAKEIFRFFFYFSRISLASVQSRTCLIKWGEETGPVLGNCRPSDHV